MRYLKSDFDKMIKSLQNKSIYFYRVTYNDEGIYNALKKSVDIEVWKEILSNKRINWLPKPPSYDLKNKSYFTKKGYKRFETDTLPLISKYLEKENIKVNIHKDITKDILYKDDYQIVTKD